jgi:hypothetical protein
MVIDELGDILYWGYFLGFGVEFEECQGGVGQYTIALIEHEDGDVFVERPENIVFKDKVVKK